MTAPRPRRLLSRDADLGTRYRIYQVPGALEVDELSYIERRRRRVFFDEVVLVTLHRFRPAGVLWTAGLVAALFGGLALMALANDLAGLAAAFALTGAFPALVFLLAAAFPRHAVTVFGLRNRARIVRRWSGRRARDLYARLCRDIAEAQRPAGGGAPAGEEG